MEEEVQDAPEQDHPLSLGEHLEELRRRLFRAVLFFVIATVICLYFQDELMHIITRPHVHAMQGVSQEIAAKRRKALLEKNPFKDVRSRIEFSKGHVRSREPMDEAMTHMPEKGEAAGHLRKAFDKFVEAERNSVETMRIEDFLDIYDARREIMIALDQVKTSAKLDNEAEFSAAEKAILDWTNPQKGSLAAFREFLRVVEDEHNLDRLSGEFQKLRVLKPQESFLSHLKIALIAALFLASPFVLYQLWAFISVGLYKRERRVAYFFGPSSFLLFVCGILFGYFVLIPLGLRFLLGFGDPDLVETNITLGFYLSFFVLLTLVVGLVFELPLAMYVIARIGLISPKGFSKGRRYFIVLAFVFGALLTPPDIITQVLLAMPMLVLYEIGIILARFAKKKGDEALLGGAADTEDGK